jgi:uncharacterized linocin/CFP29 family protein
MSHLLRSSAPISDDGWRLLDEEAKERLTPALAARKLVDFSGPHGWQYSATNLGRTALLGAGPCEGVVARQRRVLTVVENRIYFEVDRNEIEDAERGAQDLDFSGLESAARQAALAENIAVFHGFEPAGVRGITDSSSHDPIALDGDFDHYPGFVARAVNVLRTAGIDGPYALALSPEEYTGVIETTEHGGFLVFDHLNRVLGGPIVWTPGVRTAVVLSVRGGDFLFESGQDLSIGYDSHSADSVRLYLEETFTFRVTEPDSAIELRR